MITAMSIVLNETWKGFLILWSYRINILISLASMAISFVGVSFLMTEGKFNPQLLASTLIGFLAWYLILLVTANMGENLMLEAQAGTLEQMFISPVSIGVILIGRTFANLISSGIQILLVGGAAIFFLNIPFKWPLAALPVLALTIMGVFGLGFVLGGLTLIFKQAAAMANLVNNILIFLNGALVPVDRFPPWLEAISKTLPSTQGIIVLRKVIVDGQSLSSAWNDGSLVLLLIHSLFYFIGGWIILKWCERLAKKRGSLGQY